MGVGIVFFGGGFSFWFVWVCLVGFFPWFVSSLFNVLCPFSEDWVNIQSLGFLNNMLTEVKFL